MNERNLARKGQAWEFEFYGTLCAMTKIDVNVPSKFGGESLRQTFTLIFIVDPKEIGERGVDDTGSRASGHADATIIDGTVKPNHRLVEIGDTILTPFGNYRIEFHNEGLFSNTDHLTLIPLGDGKEV